MAHKVITPVAAEPISLAQAKNHLRVEISETADDALITALITAARESAEHYAGRAFAEQTLEAAYDGFPADDYLKLPFGPAASVTSVKYDDTDGVEQTFADYALSSYGTADRIDLAADAEWPSTEDAAESVRVRYVTKAECPKAAYAAMLLIIAHLYEVRGTDADDIPAGAKALLDTVKVYG